jgi:hypothetical protein
MDEVISLDSYPKETVYFICQIHKYTVFIILTPPSLQGYELREEKSVRLMDRLPNVIIKYICSFMVVHISNKHLMLPMQYWFNRNPALALPVVAMSYSHRTVNINMKTLRLLV